LSADSSDRDVGDSIEHRDVETDAICHVVQAIDGVDPADVEDVEGAAGFAVAVVLGYQHDIDQADGSFLVGAAGGTVRGAAAIVRDQSRGEDNRESYKGQHFRSHRISSNDVCRGPDYAFNKLSRSCARSDSRAGPRSNQRTGDPRRSRPGSEPELNAFDKHKVIAGRNALHAWIMELVDVQVRFDENPVVEIPVESNGPLGSVVAKGGDHAWRNRAGGSGGGIARDAAGSALQPGITGLEGKRAPARATRFSGGIRANYGVLDARNGVFRLSLAGEQICRRYVSALAHDTRKRVEADAAGDE